jgi:phosphoglycerol transferase
MAGMRLLNRKSIMCIVICVLISSTFIYYPFFTCFFLLIAGITGYISQRNRYPLLNSLILISIIILGLLVNASPSLIYEHENGKNPEVAIRGPAESEIYGLKIAQLLVPISGHRIPLLAKLSGYYSGTAPLVNENATASLGIIGSIGFLLLIAWAFYRASNGLKLKAGDNLSHINELSILNLSSVLLATIGGFGTIFAYLIYPQIRGYNRICIFIAFFSLFAIVLSFEEFSRRYVKSKNSRILFNLFLGLILLVGVFDQTSALFVPPYDSIKSEYLNDENFVDNIQTIMPENAMIFQLPYMPFPEYAPVYKMENYFHFKAYLHSKDLRWSYGVMKGRTGDDWQRLVASMPVEDMVKTLSQAGFEGIYIDSYGFEDGGSKMLSNLTRILKKEPMVSDNRRLYFFDMTGYNKIIKANPNEKYMIPIAIKSGWYGIEDWSGTSTRWMEADASIVVFSPENGTSNLSLNVQSFYRSRTLEIFSGDTLVAQVAVPPSFINMSVPVQLAKGANTVRLHVPEGCERPCDLVELNNRDSRCLSVAVQNIIAV